MQLDNCVFKIIIFNEKITIIRFVKQIVQYYPTFQSLSLFTPLEYILTWLNSQNLTYLYSITANLWCQIFLIHATFTSLFYSISFHLFFPLSSTLRIYFYSTTASICFGNYPTFISGSWIFHSYPIFPSPFHFS